MANTHELMIGGADQSRVVPDVQDNIESLAAELFRLDVLKVRRNPPLVVPDLGGAIIWATVGPPLSCVTSYIQRSAGGSKGVDTFVLESHRGSQKGCGDDCFIARYRAGKVALTSAKADRTLRPSTVKAPYLLIRTGLQQVKQLRASPKQAAIAADTTEALKFMKAYEHWPKTERARKAMEHVLANGYKP